MNGNHVAVQIGRLIRAVGGKWDPNKKVWKLLYKKAVASRLENRAAKRKSKCIVLGKRTIKIPLGKCPLIEKSFFPIVEDNFK